MVETCEDLQIGPDEHNDLQALVDRSAHCGHGSGDGGVKAPLNSIPMKERLGRLSF